MLQRYAELKAWQNAIAAELAEIEAQLRQTVDETGEVAGFGYRAYYKPGHKSTDHEAAVNAILSDYDKHEMHSLANHLREIQDEFSATKVTVAWAKVTKKAKIDVTPFTVDGPPSFEIDKI